MKKDPVPKVEPLQHTSVKPLDAVNVPEVVSVSTSFPPSSPFTSGILAVSTTGGIEFVHLAEITRLSAERAYTRFHFRDGTYLLASHNLGAYARMLAASSTPCFFRLHESHIVNIQFIRRFLFEDGGILEMNDGSRVPVAKRRKGQFLNWLRRVQEREGR